MIITLIIKNIVLIILIIIIVVIMNPVFQSGPRMGNAFLTGAGLLRAVGLTTFILSA